MEKSSLNISIEKIKGVGIETKRILRNNNIFSTYQLVNYLPKKYENYFETDIDLARHGDTITVVGALISNIIVSPLNKVLKIEFMMLVKHYHIKVMMFRPTDYLSDYLKVNDTIQVHGKFNLYKSEITAINVKKYNENAHKIIPKYNIDGITDYMMQKIMENTFNDNLVTIIETIPTDFINKYKLLSRKESLYKLHLPTTHQDIEDAYLRLKYEEALYLQVGIESKRKKVKREPVNYDLTKVKEFTETIPYELTLDQKNAVNDIFRDFKGSFLSFRLIQGDVGSGKTIVALIAAYGMITANKQVALMAPTEILANQHYEVVNKLFNNKIRVALLTQKTKDKEKLKSDIQNGLYDFVIGTHALIENDVIFKNLGLAIIDEQHRFGVVTRELLESKNENVDCLYLSATPIPRTLAISIFGNMDITNIKEKPKGRIEGKTFYYSAKNLKEAYKTMHEELDKGNQAFVVVPAISSDLKEENIQTATAKIQKEFTNQVFIVHGKLKNSEVEETINAFKNTKGSILIATSMIEVGIDIKDATVMTIFSAENFGLSQLHQLRGRIGRNNKLSYCFLISSKPDIDRLSFLTTTYDGFALSEYDLKERGPGEFIGVKQSGKLEYNFINFNTDYHILKNVKKDAYNYLNQEDFWVNPKYYYLRKFLDDNK